MASTSETGHGVNVENGKKMVGVLSTIGKQYAPANKKLVTAEVEKKVQEANGKMDAIEAPEKLYNDVRTERQNVYADVDDTVDLIINNLEACDGVSTKTIKSAKTLGKKIKGTNTKSSKKGGKGGKTPSADPANPAETDDSPNSISTSQQSYDMRFTNLKNLVALVKAEPNYVTNEPEAQVANLDKKIATMEAVNKKMKPIEVTYKKALEERDIALYYPETGLLDLIKKVKKAVAGSKGISDAEKEAVKNLKFTAPSKRKLHFSWPKASA